MGVTYDREIRTRPDSSSPFGPPSLDADTQVVDSVDVTNFGDRYAPISGGHSYYPDLGNFWGTNRVQIRFLAAVGTHVPPVTAGSALAIKVTDDQEGCMIYDTDTAEIFVDSRLA